MSRCSRRCRKSARSPAAARLHLSATEVRGAESPLVGCFMRERCRLQLGKDFGGLTFASLE